MSPPKRTRMMLPILAPAGRCLHDCKERWPLFITFSSHPSNIPFHRLPPPKYIERAVLPRVAAILRTSSLVIAKGVYSYPNVTVFYFPLLLWRKSWKKEFILLLLTPCFISDTTFHFDTQCFSSYTVGRQMKIEAAMLAWRQTGGKWGEKTILG